MLAKSDGTTLKEHTNDLLKVFESLKEAFYFDDPFWQDLKISIIFHDIGKATSGFQEFLKNDKRYGFRHEILSAIVAKNYTEKEEIINAILAHHKNFVKVKELLKEYENNKKYQVDRWVDKEFNELDKKWVKKFLRFYGFELKDIKLYNIEENVKKWTSKRRLKNIGEKEKFRNIFLSAGLSICDHNASAGILDILNIKEENFNFLNSINFYAHQESSFKCNKNGLLIAPTGAGKTESALAWLKNQIQKRQGRVFYILPFTASINAMAKRMINEFENENLIGFLHGKAKFFINEIFESKDGVSLKELIDINKKIIKPFKIVTPFQILKWAFGVKGFEKGLFELKGSYLIFDEIHIYDKELYKKIIFFIEWLMEKLDVKIFIMSATIPTFIQKQIQNVLNTQLILPDEKFLYKIKRHRIKLLNSSIEENLNKIESFLKDDKKVLIVCNTVAKAQKIFQNIDCKDKVLLHSAFNVRDRIKKEQQLLDFSPKLLIGTQAIEVSLDIDYDVIITEIAPLDALLQRFGRVYRKRELKSKDTNCFVTTKIEKEHKLIYDEKILLKTIEELKKCEGNILKENSIQKMLDNVYEAFDLNEDDLRENFRKLLDNLYPFNEYEDSEEEFFSQFDGIEVLPFELEDEFIKLIDNQQYIEAEKLFVSITKRKFAQYKNKGMINYFQPNNYGKIIPILDLKYSDELGLLKEEEKNFNGFVL